MSLRVAGICCSGSTMNQNYTNILLMLLRHRQACDHPFLSKIIFPIAEKIPRDMQINLLNCLVTMFAICRVYDVSFFFLFSFEISGMHLISSCLCNSLHLLESRV
jgi:hypothetical protein